MGNVLSEILGIFSKKFRAAKFSRSEARVNFAQRNFPEAKRGVEPLGEYVGDVGSRTVLYSRESERHNSTTAVGGP